MDPSLSKQKEICILPKLGGLGGPVSFHNRFVNGLRERDIGVSYDALSENCNAILVIGGTRRLDVLWRAHRRGARIVQRLNGMNWLHRKRPSSLRYYLRSELNNRILATIRRHLADQVVYQSKFARSWWQTVYAPVPADGKIIYNGVDLKIFSPEGSEKPPLDHVRLLLVEAHVGGGYEKGLENAIKLTEMVSGEISQHVELMVVGDVSDELRGYWDQQTDIWITWKGPIPQEEIPQLDRSAHILFSSDLNAACPNSVVEALACGLPVVSFATGSLPELVNSNAGLVVPYGSNYWNLEAPDINPLAEAVQEILSDLPKYKIAARQKAVEVFSQDKMVDEYVNELLG
jgi:glycosyltransferase involved in cell wall biosynthesis